MLKDNDLFSAYVIYKIPSRPVSRESEIIYLLTQLYIAIPLFFYEFPANSRMLF
jgi:hypothetical protein